MTSNETFHDINEMQRCATLCSSLARIAEMLDSCLCPAMDVKCDEQKDQMQQLVEEVPPQFLSPSDPKILYVPGAIKYRYAISSIFLLEKRPTPPKPCRAQPLGPWVFFTCSHEVMASESRTVCCFVT